MNKNCPTCGTELQTDARFCRNCGTPVARLTGGGGEGVSTTDAANISPQAPTVRLTDEGRNTDGLAPDDLQRGGGGAADTTRVSRADLERLLHAQTSAGARPDDAGREDAFSQSEYATLLNVPLASQGGDAHDTGEIPSATSTDDIGMQTRPAFQPPDADEEMTITVPRVARPFDGSQTPIPVEFRSTTPGAQQPGESAGTAAAASSSQPLTPTQVPPATTPPAPPVAAQSKRRIWPYLLAAACVALLAFVALAGWFVLTRWRNITPVEVSSVPPVAPPDAKQLFEAKMSEASALLDAGDTSGGIARLQEANALDPSNTRAHQRLGEVFLESGKRAEAIAEFRAVTQNAPEDFAAWRALGSAQLAEGLYADAAESYRRLVALVGDASVDPNDLLAYADALRQSGRMDEARAVYQRLSSASASDVAALARQHLAELSAQASPSITPTPKPNETARERAERENAQNLLAQANVSATPQPVQTPAPTPAPTPIAPVASTPAEHYQRGVELWSSNRAAAVREFLQAQGNPDADYYLGLNLVEGKDLSNLNRAALVAALGYFQRAERGPHAAQARRYAQQLGVEFDKLRRP